MMIPVIASQFALVAYWQGFEESRSSMTLHLLLIARHLKAVFLLHSLLQAEVVWFFWTAPIVNL
jgi:hypothetical protein